MNKKAIKSLAISLIMAVQLVLPVMGEEIKDKEVLTEKVNLTETADNEILDADNEVDNNEKENSSNLDKNNDNFEILEHEEEKKPQPSELISLQKKNTLSVDIYIDSIKNFKLSKATFVLYNKEFQAISEKSFFIDNTNVNHTFTFDVPEYNVGEVFYLSCTEGVDCIKYKEEFFGIGHRIKLETFLDSVEQESGNIVYGNQFSVTAYPVQDKEISFLLNGNKKHMMFPVKLDENTAIISFPDVVKLFGLTEEQYLYNSQTGEINITFDEKGVILFIGRNEGYVKEETKSITAPRIIDGIIYLPLRFVMEGLGADINASVLEKSMRVDMTLSSIKYIEHENFINRQGIISKTNYLLWVSKPNFTVTVFTKTNEGWKAIKDMPCSIGAPRTPTVVGQFEYFSKEKQWSYPGYYVAPIMRFYSGYAFHSTLIRYDGTPYDSRVGKQISHGCVRMRPEDINWMADTIPLYTKVYITN